jgi:glycosyltransferase involved in cell wall biosynthesis
MRRLKVLVSSYACAPWKGSEPGAGFSHARQMAEHHDVWVITRAKNREAIESELTEPHPNLHFVYFDLPKWARFWKRGSHAVYFYYYLWQIGAYRIAKQLHEREKFDLVHHMTFGAMWMPSLMALLPAPFVWGPVGGGEYTPDVLRNTLRFQSSVYEAARDAARWLGMHDPCTSVAARRSAVALVTTQETAERVRAMGAENIVEFYQVGLSEDEINYLAAIPEPPKNPFRVISIGRLLDWKGFELGLRAFAQADVPDSEYWFLGEGPERRRLERLANRLDIAPRVHFFGQLPRVKALGLLGQCHALVHPSMHESGGTCCLEAMTARRPVICLDWGGPGRQVTAETGFAIAPARPEMVIRGIASAIRRLAADDRIRSEMGRAAQQRVREQFAWPVKARRLSEIYLHAVGASQRASERPVTRAAELVGET